MATATLAPTGPAFRKKPALGKYLFGALVALMYLFLLAPLIIVLVISFQSNQYLSFPPEGFTLRWYAELPGQAKFLEGGRTSLIVASLVTVVVLALGVPAALAINRYEFRFKPLVESLFMLPLLVPSIVLALGMVLLFTPFGLTNSYPGLVIGHVAITIPYVVRTTLMSLATSDTSCEEAARVLGASPWQTFTRVTLPIIQPGIIAGGVIAFIVSFDEAVISLFIAESGLPTLPVHVLRYVETSADAAVAALSVVLIAISLVVVVIVERVMGLRKAL